MPKSPPTKFHSQLEREIAAILESSEFIKGFEYEPRIGGLRPDFVALTANGTVLLIEAKGWSGDAAHIERAKRQADLFRAATGADVALVVLSKGPQADVADGVVGLDQLPVWLSNFADRNGSEPTGKPQESTSTASPFSVFAAMPFSSAYDDVFFVAMSHAAAAVGATCVRVDHEDFEGDIVAEIRKRIENSVAVIADLSESRPNVLYEVGYAHALNKPTVHICCTPMSELPFDVSHQNTLAYTAGQTHAFKEKLAKRLKALVESRAI